MFRLWLPVILLCVGVDFVGCDEDEAAMSEMFLAILDEWEMSHPVLFVSDPSEYLEVFCFFFIHIIQNIIYIIPTNVILLQM